MSINYTTLFTRLGKCVKWLNLFLGYQGTNILGTAPNGVADDVLSQYEARRDLVPSFESTSTGWANSIAGWNGVLKSLADTTLSDLQSALEAPGSSITTILPLLYAQMVVDSQTIQKNTGISASVSAGTNTGTGVLLASVVNVNGINDERIFNETVKVKCISDQWSGSATAGSESFSVTGEPKLSSPNVHGAMANGNGPNLSVAYARNMVTNGNFETFTVANTPDNWTIDAGVAGTTIFQDTTGADVHTGLSALKLAGNGTATTITLHQPINTLITSSKIYCASIWLRKSGTVTSGSTLTVHVTGTSFGPFTLFNADPSTLTTSYVNYNIFFATGSTFSADAKFEITWTSANTAGASAFILIDDALLIAPQAFGNVQYVLLRGSSDFAIGDSFTVTTANGNGGVFQTAFARWYNFQLPSSASPSIADSLAV